MFMRWFWLAVLVCFVSVSTHEVAAHAGTCSCAAEFAGKHRDEEARPDDSPDTHDGHHDGDSHGHFGGAVSAPAKPIIKILVLPGTPVVFHSFGVLPQEHLFIALRRALGPPAPGLPRYLSAQSLLL